MLKAVKHHRAVVEYIDDLSEIEFDAASGIEPVSAKARDSAFRLLARRVDLAIGMSVQMSSAAGLKMDLLRNGREYVIEIDSKGRISMVAAASGSHRQAFGISHGSINRAFLSKLEQEIPDPARGQSPDFDLMPLPGVITETIFGTEGLSRVSALKRQYLGVHVTNARYGFDTACFLTDAGAGLDADGIEELIRSRIDTGKGIYLGRRFRDTSLVSLHDITQCPAEVLQGGVLSSGHGLHDLKHQASRGRCAAETLRDPVPAAGK